MDSEVPCAQIFAPPASLVKSFAVVVTPSEDGCELYLTEAKVKAEETTEGVAVGGKVMTEDHAGKKGGAYLSGRGAQAEEGDVVSRKRERTGV